MKVPKIVRAVAGKWTTPQLLAVHDVRLGLLHKVLSLAIFVYVCTQLFMDSGYEYRETPLGYPTFWFESGELYETQNNLNPESFCDNDRHNYSMKSYDNYYWNNFNISCAPLHYGEIVLKSAKSGFVTTLMKRQHWKTEKCSTGANKYPCSSSMLSSQRQTNRIVKNLCSCSSQEDYYVAGVGKMQLYLEHAFTASSIYHENDEGETIQGSSTSKENEVTTLDKAVKTCVIRKGETKCHQTFEPGSKINNTLDAWLEIAGVNLDTRLKGTVEKDVRTGQFPYRRSTGIKLQFQMKYEGDISDDTYQCTLTVKAIDGWNSIGSKITYLSNLGFESQEYYDDYRLGVTVEFFPTGIITKFHWQTLFQTLIAGLVLLGSVDAVVGFVALYLHPDKKTLKNAKTSNLQVSKALAQFGISSALACHAFKAWDTHKGEKPEISGSELCNVFSGAFGEADAAAFTQTVLEAVHILHPGKETLEAKDLVELMGDGLVSIETMRAFAERNKGTTSSSKVHVQPAGEA
eukprot:TRINITY_DN5274_c0_g1_i1.p1 TRINITY_DN5274_c0_g1~~TRINITY_DN5274_c0_g1_i1.p1  ORF type:complete len:518 (+),score=69.47 TRINITY_DN5274_c0_g1_i1:54-1607(+)